jgi:hypothetical protein
MAIIDLLEHYRPRYRPNRLPTKIFHQNLNILINYLRSMPMTQTIRTFLMIISIANHNNNNNPDPISTLPSLFHPLRRLHFHHFHLPLP